ncbi:MAG TPA: phosphoglycerate mutase family protein [Candidatus Dormibacteraeota bacterium]|nr:phosphoglycerate mutase family protein [Candidatus Dormibacteraeota bacterium]
MATFYFVRHAKAGSRSHWTGDDRKRPLSKKGERQAQDLVTTFANYDLTAVYSSPYLRCMQTVEPLARAHRLKVQAEPGLAEGRGLEAAYRFFADPKLDEVVLCTHGDIVWELIEDLTRRKVLPAFREDFDKGSTWVVQVKEGVPVKARYIPAP